MYAMTLNNVLERIPQIPDFSASETQPLRVVLRILTDTYSTEVNSLGWVTNYVFRMDSKKSILPQFRTLSQHLPDATEKAHENYQ
jgi:hypothetical protein